MKMTEIGYPQDIALRVLIGFYVHDKRLNSELAGISKSIQEFGRQQPNLAESILSILPHDPWSDLVQGKNLYTRFTDRWLALWNAYVEVIPVDLQTSIKNISERWGLNSPWGCGYVIDLCLGGLKSVFSTVFTNGKWLESKKKEQEKTLKIQAITDTLIDDIVIKIKAKLDNTIIMTNDRQELKAALVDFIERIIKKEEISEYELPETSLTSLSFLYSPMPQENSHVITIKVPIRATDDNASQKKITDARKDAKTALQNIRSNLTKMDYRGYSRGNKKDIYTQVKWLYWHITPSYPNTSEISSVEKNSTSRVLK